MIAPLDFSSFRKTCYFGSRNLENVLFCFQETPSLTWYNSRFPRSEA